MYLCICVSKYVCMTSVLLNVAGAALHIAVVASADTYQYVCMYVCSISVSICE